MIEIVTSVRWLGRKGFCVAGPALLAVTLAVATPTPAAFAQATPPNAETAPPNAVEDFARQVEDLKKSYPDLGKKIDDSAKSIDELTDVDKARREIEELRGIVANMLGAVSDNGTVAQLGAKALAHARAKLKALEQDSRFKVEEKAFLTDLWRKLIAETERASDDLDSARKEFAELLRTLQTREDFIDELMQVRRASEALSVLRQLTKEIRDASGKLKTLIGGIKAPGV